ncbi:MAG: hypothetical protein HY689_00950 [Chloroflexi bacterium]|nr:hypothetical protein [Chloroflexota bacterium]
MRVRLWTAVRPRVFPFPGSGVALLAPALAAAAALAALLLLALTGYVTAAGYQVRSLERARAAQERSLQQLAADVASLRSLARAEQEAKARWNMAPPQQVLHVAVEVAPAAALTPSERAPWGSGRP